MTHISLTCFTEGKCGIRKCVFSLFSFTSFVFSFFPVVMSFLFCLLFYVSSDWLFLTCYF